MKVSIRYNFIFDPTDLWQHAFQFDNDLISYFKSLGFDTEIIKSENEASNEIMMYLDKVELINSNPPQSPPDKTIKQSMANLQKRKGYDGKFKKPNT